MYLEKLNEEQILELSRLLIGVSWEKYKITPHSYPLRLERGISKECRLCSYELIDANYPIENWKFLTDDFSDRNGIDSTVVKYMYSIFGETYKQDYIDYCMSVFD